MGDAVRIDFDIIRGGPQQAPAHNAAITDLSFTVPLHGYDRCLLKAQFREWSAYDYKVTSRPWQAAIAAVAGPTAAEAAKFISVGRSLRSKLFQLRCVVVEVVVARLERKCI